MLSLRPSSAAAAALNRAQAGEQQEPTQAVALPTQWGGGSSPTFTGDPAVLGMYWEPYSGPDAWVLAVYVWSDGSESGGDDTLIDHGIVALDGLVPETEVGAYA